MADATTFTVKTSAHAVLVDITGHVREVLSASGRREGVVVVYVPHTTAGVTIQENADPDVQRDILTHLDKMVPWRGDYRHGEGNAAAHIKASLLGSSATIPVSGGRLELGTWQGIYVAEFDGPRTRRVIVRTLPG